MKSPSQSSSDNNWKKMIKRLQAFQQENQSHYQEEHGGNCTLNRYPHDPKLVYWLNAQRKKYKNGTLTKDRCDQLDSTGFQWKLNSSETKWTEMFKRLQVYQRDHRGSLEVPRGLPQLGSWVQRQRDRYKKGVLAKHEYDQLEAIGFQWKIRERANHSWTEMFSRLKAYHEENNTGCGSCNSPKRYSPKRYLRDPKLGKWFDTQRQKYKIGKLSKDQCDQLDSISIQWKDDLLDVQWTEMFKRLQAYQQEHKGSCNLPYQLLQDPKLFRWVTSQRKRFEKGLLSKHRCNLLDSTGFQWKIGFFEDQWNEMFKRLQAYQRDHQGSCYVPRKYSQDPKLGAWVYKQRCNYKNGYLSKDRRDRLDAIGFRITKKCMNFNDRWSEMFKRLQEYQGRCSVPVQYCDDLQLDNWVQTQRQQHRKGTLRKDHYDQLDAIGFEFTTIRKKLKDKGTEMSKRPLTYQPDHHGSFTTPARCHQDLKDKGTEMSKRPLTYQPDHQGSFTTPVRCHQDLKDKGTEMSKRSLTYQPDHQGSCTVPVHYHQDLKDKATEMSKRSLAHQRDQEPKLGIWVQNRRQPYKTGIPSIDRCDRLDAIGFQWESSEERWPETFYRPQNYHLDHQGWCSVPTAHSRSQTFALAHQGAALQAVALAQRLRARFPQDPKSGNCFQQQHQLQEGHT